MNDHSLFPYEKVRDIQDDMLQDVADAVKNKKHLIVHAPTGLGKTVATLAPALEEAIKKGLTIFFLTSRHTQHQIAITTLKEIKEKHGTQFNAVDIIGKKWMCTVPGTDLLYSGDFSEYCKDMREKGKCEFYNNTKKSNKLTIIAQKVLGQIKDIGPCHVDKLIELCADEKLCPYEMSTALANQSNVIIADYFYIFNQFIRDSFLSKTNKNLGESIVIVDEGHNLPYRIRDLVTQRLSNTMLRNAIKEAKKLGFSETIEILSKLQDILNKYSTGMNIGNERIVKKEDFVEDVNKVNDYEQVLADLEFIGDEIRVMQKQSYVGGIAKFLEHWKGTDDGFVRIMSVIPGKNQPIAVLSYRCLDPSVISKEVIAETHSTIIMSGTLTPTELYKDLLGFPDETVEKEYESPFDENNKLTLVIPETTTKFTMRTPEQFKRIAQICSDIINIVPGNSAVFFPSYKLRDDIYKYLYPICKKTCFLEQPRTTKQEKTEILEKFKSYKKVGAALFGVATGSFGEGVDLPGDLLKCVIVVGLPLQQPDLETKEVINYYNEKFGKGMDYGYIFPAFTKCLQNAGRCVRSETDKGVVVFLDERYVWPMYSRCFTNKSEIEVTRGYEDKIEEFFESHK